MKVKLTKRGITFSPSTVRRAASRTFAEFGRMPLTPERISMTRRAMRLDGKLEKIGKAILQSTKAKKADKEEIEKALRDWKEIRHQVDFFFMDSIDRKKVDPLTGERLRHEIRNRLDVILQSAKNLHFYENSPLTQELKDTLGNMDKYRAK